MPQKLSVLIPDGESPFAYHVLTCLAQVGGMEIHVLSRRADVMSRYSRVRKSFTFLSVEEDLLESIKSFCSRVHVDLIMPVDMNALFYFADHREPAGRIAGLCLLENSKKLQIVSDKGLLADFLVENELPHPESITNFDQFNKVIDRFSMPILLKPRTAGNGEGILKYADREELMHLVRTQTGFFEQYLIQEYMEGEDIDCSVLCRDGVILAYTIQRALYNSTKFFQPAEAIEFVQDADVLEVATQLMNTLNWTGIAHIDMRRRSNGRVEIIEVNPRYWGSVQGSLMAGVNFPLLASIASRGGNFPVPHYQNTKYMSGFAAFKRMWQRQPTTRLIRETNLLTMMKDPLPNLMKFMGLLK